jgi:hypothetical protein
MVAEFGTEKEADIINLSKSFTDPYTMVDTATVQVDGQDVGHKIAVRVRDDAGEWSKTPFIMSRDYNLIHNSLARDAVLDIMSRSALQWKHLKTMWDGRRYACHYISKEPIFTVEGGIIAYPFLVGITGRNTYDGSGLLAFEVFACALSCLNQFRDRNRFGFFAIRHDHAQPDIGDALQNLSLGIGNLIKFAPAIRQLRGEPITAQAILDARMNISIPTSKWGEVLERMLVEESTMFGLLQALTFVSTHSLNGFSSFGVSESIVKHLVRG